MSMSLGIASEYKMASLLRASSRFRSPNAHRPITTTTKSGASAATASAIQSSSEYNPEIPSATADQSNEIELSLEGDYRLYGNV